MTARLLKLDAVKKITAQSKSAIYEKISGGKFPPPVRLGERAVAWVEDEVNAWVSARMEERCQA
ncbi:MAG: AlpA family phage regulatory protein [Rhodocyclaceae bacterium]|nr:AlpA family phage regulatory protein [Rhodocyclaceae bacterium]